MQASTRAAVRSGRRDTMTLVPEGSVTCWLQQLQAGDQTAAQELWNRYFARLVGLARSKLRGAPRRAADEMLMGAGRESGVFLRRCSRRE